MLNNRWAVLVLLLVVRIAMGFQFQSVAAVAPLLSDDLQLDHAGIGTLIGFYMLPGLVIALPGGYLGGRFRDLTMAAFGVLLMAAGGGICALATGYELFAAGRLLSGAGGVLQGIFVMKMVADWFDGREVITALALILSGLPLGIALALPVGGAMAEIYGWQATMLLAGGLCLVALILMLAFYRAPPQPGDVQAGGMESGGISRPEFILVVVGSLIWTLYNISYFAYLSFGPAMLMERGMTMLDAGFVISLTSWISMFAVPVGGVIAERSGRPLVVLVVGCLVSGGCLLLMPVIDNVYLVGAAVGIFASVPAGIIMAAAIGVVAPRHRAKANGIIYTFFYGGIGICPAIVGWAADASGTAATPVYISGVVLLITAAAFPAFRLWTRRTTRAAAAVG
jgi:predicted MFS family arabinose efflux permease